MDLRNPKSSQRRIRKMALSRVVHVENAAVEAVLYQTNTTIVDKQRWAKYKKAFHERAAVNLL